MEKKNILGKFTVLYFTVALEILARKTPNVFIHMHVQKDTIYSIKSDILYNTIYMTQYMI